LAQILTSLRHVSGDGFRVSPENYMSRFRIGRGWRRKGEGESVIIVNLCSTKSSGDGNVS